MDATPGGTSANSYLTVDDADALAADLGLTAWDGVEDAAKTSALIAATAEINSHRVHHPTPYIAGQALSFPRCKDAGVIPPAILRACVYQAEWIARAGSGDRQQWKGNQGQAAGNDSPLCPQSYTQLAKFISRAGTYS